MSTPTNTQRDKYDRAMGIALTRQSVLKLDQLVVQAHVTLGLPVVSMSPFPTTVTGRPSVDSKERGNSAGFSVVQPGVLSSVHAVLSAECIPVFHGDVVLDANQVCAVFGGDHIIAW